MANRDRAAALVAVNTAALIFGATALFGKLPIAPVWIVAARGAFAALTLAPIAYAQRRTVVAGIPLKDALITGMLLALHWVSFFVAVQRANVAVATLTFATFPLFTIVAESVMQRRWPRGVEWGAGVAIICGAALIAGPGLPHTDTAVFGAVAGMVSAISFAGFGLRSQIAARSSDPVRLSMVQNLIVALFLVPQVIFAAPMPLTVRDWVLLALLGVVATALSHQLYFFGLKRMPASVCGAFISLEPVYAIVMAAILFREPIGLPVIASAVLIIGASIMLLRLNNRVAEVVVAP